MPTTDPTPDLAAIRARLEDPQFTRLDAQLKQLADVRVDDVFAILAAYDDQAARLAAVEQALRVYADQENWWQADHVEQRPEDPFYGISRKVWAWGDMRDPWRMAEAALKGAPDA